MSRKIKQLREAGNLILSISFPKPYDFETHSEIISVDFVFSL